MECYKCGKTIEGKYVQITEGYFDETGHKIPNISFTYCKSCMEGDND